MATEITSTSAKAWAMDLHGVAPRDAVPDALILNTSTVAGQVEGDEPAVRVQYVDDATAGFVAEGSTISEANPDLAECVVHTGKVAQLIRLSREQFQQPNAQELLAESVGRAVTKAANRAYIQQFNPASTTQVVTISGSPSGGTFLLSYDGDNTATIAYNATNTAVESALQALGGPLAAATVAGSAGGPWTVTVANPIGPITADGSALSGGTNPEVTVTSIGSAVTPPSGLLYVSGITDGGAVATDLDGLIDLQANLAAADGNPTHILLSPTAWASLRKFKDTSGSARNLLGAGVEDTVPSLLNLPVIVTNALPAGAGLMLDQSAIVSAVGPVSVAISEQAYFASDSMGVRCTWRFGSNVVHPDRVGRFTVTDPS